MTAAAGAGRYEVLGQLATGGMGEILLARRRGPGGFERLVVLKRPLATSRASRASRDLAAALIEEARLLAQIDHANVCRLHDLEEADGQYFLALELLEGLPLWTILTCARESRRPIDPRAICGMFEQICDGLDAIHQLRLPDGTPAGVVHRDLSPGNLFVTESGTVKILDLGIAKTAASEDLTPLGTIKGKLPYLAPEQAAGKPVDARTDLFSLGLVLFDTARGSPPPGDRIGALASDELEFDDIAPPLVRVIQRAVHREPAERFGSAAELATAIRAASHALGGSLGRAELAAWLSREFADELEAQRARTQAAMTEGVGRTVTRTLTLRSALLRSMSVDDLTDADASTGEVVRELPATAPIPPPPKRATERLPAEGDPPPADAAPAAPHRKRATERLPTADDPPLGATAPARSTPAPYAPSIELARSAPAPAVPASHAPAAASAPHAPAPHTAAPYGPAAALILPTTAPFPHAPASYPPALYPPAEMAFPAPQWRRRWAVLALTAGAILAAAAIIAVLLPHVPPTADSAVARVLAAPAPPANEAAHPLEASRAASDATHSVEPAPVAPETTRQATPGPPAPDTTHQAATAPAAPDVTRPIEAPPTTPDTARAASLQETGPDDAVRRRTAMPMTPSTSIARAAPPPRSEASRPQRNAPGSRLAASSQQAMAPGLITIGSMPWADVWIGDRKLRTDVWRVELPPGRHTLRARTGDGREQTVAFTIESGKEKRIVLRWSPS